VKEKYGVVDIGSNSIKLNIFTRDTKGNFKKIDNEKITARLMEYLDNDNVFNEQGVMKLLDILQVFKGKLDYYDLKNVNFIATAVLRKASNKNEILCLIEQATGFSVKVLSEYEEAYFGFLATVHYTSVNDGISVDLGGGSAEITKFNDKKLRQYHSLPFGAITLKEQFVLNRVPSDEERESIRCFLQSELQNIAWLQDTNLPVIALGGSAKSLIRIAGTMNINHPMEKKRSSTLSAEQVKSFAQYLYSLDAEQLINVRDLPKDRLELIIPAMLFFEVLAELTKTPSMLVLKKGLREGVLLEECKKIIR
jgi:exopolyphosphatase/guanosine-5'-triphosphate,3'-diphosphate pyrophosphatase